MNRKNEENVMYFFFLHNDHCEALVLMKLWRPREMFNSFACSQAGSPTDRDTHKQTYT